MQEVTVEVGRFAWERHLRDDDAMTGNRLLVLLVLATYMDEDGTHARPSVETLAAKTGLHSGSVSRHLKAARDAGWIERVSRGHRRWDGVGVSSVYRATMSTAHPCAVESALNRADDALKRAPVRAQPRNECAVTIPDHGLTTGDHGDDVVALASSLCSQPSDPLKRRGEVNSNLDRLKRAHDDDDAILEALHSMRAKGYSYGFPRELVAALEAALPAAPQSKGPYPNPYDYDEAGNLVTVS